MATDTRTFRPLAMTSAGKDGVEITVNMSGAHFEVPPFVPSPMVEGTVRLMSATELCLTDAPVAAVPEEKP